MTSFTHNLNAADGIARSTIADRIRQAEDRRIARAARRGARLPAEPVHHDLPVWAFRFLHPVH